MGGEVLSDRQIKNLITAKAIINADLDLVNPSSLDLRLGNNKWRLVGSTLPLQDQSIDDLLRTTSVADADHHEPGFYLERDQPVLFELVEELNLPQSVSARIHNKSGRGRIGISVKGLCNGVPRFSDIPRGYKGKVYAEVAPTAFPIYVFGGQTAVPQIRFYEGDPQLLRGAELELLLRSEPILFDKNNNQIKFSKSDLDRICRTGHLAFTADFSSELLAYKANQDRRTLNLSKKNFYRPELFFGEVRSIKDEHGLNIPSGDFVLIKSNEKIRLPPGYAVEIPDYTPELGDVRAHYAGLVNAGHGYDPDSADGGSGDHIVFEIRGRDLPVYWQHGRMIAEFEIYRMSEAPEIPYKKKQSTGFNSLPSILPDIFKKS